MTLEGKAAIVTGAGGGIGRASSVELARVGARVLLVDVDADALRETEQAVGEAGGEARSVVANVTRSEEVRDYVEAAREAFGRIDVLFNNAGIEGKVTTLIEYPEEEFDRVIAVNVRGMFLGLKHVLPVMVEQGSGSVINTSSMAGHVGFTETGIYNASKAAVISLTKTAASEVGPLGVRVNAICPGVVETRMTRSLAAGFNPDDPDTAWRELAERTPLRRFATPQEIANVVRFLASDEAGYVNGADWLVDGGVVAGR